MPRILVVDDEQPNVELLTLALGRKGFEVIGAYTGCDGLTLAQIEAPDAIVLDMMLPDIGGGEFCRQLRQTPKIAGLPVVVLTARQSTSADIDRILAAGANCYMTKPANFTELADELNHLIAVNRSPAAAQ
jgi:DNA-binding response OmpR family regulator